MFINTLPAFQIKFIAAVSLSSLARVSLERKINGGDFN
jgi:hypothetical protein